MMFNAPQRYAYSSSMDRGYTSNAEFDNPSENAYTGAENLEKPIGPARQEQLLTVADIGQTVTEGRAGGGSFIETIQAAIRKGAGSVELAAIPGGSEPGTGVESYGVDKRRELREIARANEISIMSVHTPSQIGNLSGFAGAERGFSHEQREVFLNEVKKAINFAADVTQGGAVVVHTGEFQRPISEAEWADKGRLFRQYDEEHDKAVMRIVDDRTGNIIQAIRKNQEVYRPVWLQANKDYEYVDDDGKKVQIRKEDYIDYEGRKVPMDRRVPRYNPGTGRFDVEILKWEDFEREAEKRNKELPHESRITTEEAFLRATLESQAAQARGWALYHSQRFEMNKKQLEKLKEAYEYAKKIEQETPPEERWKLMQDKKINQFMRELGLKADERALPSEELKESIKDMRHVLEHTYEGSVGYEQQAHEQELYKKHAKPIAVYAKEQSLKSYAEAGIYALDQTRDRNLPKPVFVAPEQVFPEMGYGSHPDEMIELVHNARKQMAERLMKERSYSEDQAKKAANDHIKMTLDTEHLGLWKRYFVRQAGETDQKFDERFNGWYMDQVKKMEKAGIIGHLHIADGFGTGHGNLPAGHGTMPVVDAVHYLKKKGYTGAYLSEGYGDAQRMLRDAWRAFGAHISTHGGPTGGGPAAAGMWSDVQFSYFGRQQGPYYTFGAYSPSNDWTLWSNVPME